MPYRSVFRPGLFEGQTVIVTGGGSGFGRCMAHELAALGASPVLIGRKAEKLEASAVRRISGSTPGTSSRGHLTSRNPADSRPAQSSE